MATSLRRRSLLGWLAAAFASLSPMRWWLANSAGAEPAATTTVLIVVGPSTHPPGTHEVAAGAKVMAHCLKNIAGMDRIQVTIVDHFPTAAVALETVASVVFIGDHFPLQKFSDTEKSLEKFGEMMSHGCGVACIHYATGLRAEDVQADGEHPLLHWMGGYFATKCKHHQSIARVFKDATIEPASIDHPVSRGWQTFTVNDEPYINNYFGPGENGPVPGVLTFATSMLPPEAPQRQIVAWGVDRADTGRGFAVVMPHFYRNWNDENLRRLILNGIVWTTKQNVPDKGVQTTLPDLATFLTPAQRQAISK